ncbi:nicotinate-nucleotide diphosphorylase (carboxylating) [Sutcliffiella cohnii]|uniref:Probable nicotinate-nucleotide pyrophosphorylase [carboxylating] n=1 Tax=Sutcliffiella cohnii TaxID=33932 RepID=A0A223KTA4_9BACI|nr:carboxylating nicotinate-nucleotide diphosphorylase [Sutcliffiella cohnii]AST92721.1 nicotinate-nucleotide diphosphorylase (carboxylating) [Sutcliffiella cohnii]
MNRIQLKKMLEQFFIEDIGNGDLSVQFLFSNTIGSGKLIAKEDGIFVGEAVISEGYQLLDSNVECTFFRKDGEVVQKGDVIASVQGKMEALLTGERVILNVIQRLSGIATLTNKAVQLLENSETKICDTRKTTPGLRMLEKYAVRLGGGYNHRYGLYDGVMIKDNHIEFCGGITNAVQTVRNHVGHMVKIEVETETREQVLEAVEAGADVIMFDNRSPKEILEFKKLVPPHIVTEASGGISLENLAQYGETGVDIISLGFLTHSARALDISFNVGNKNTN